MWPSLTAIGAGEESDGFNHYIPYGSVSFETNSIELELKMLLPLQSSEPDLNFKGLNHMLFMKFRPEA